MERAVGAATLLLATIGACTAASPATTLELRDSVFPRLLPPAPFIFSFPKVTDAASKPGFHLLPTPLCPNLTLRHKGFNAPQKEGAILYGPVPVVVRAAPATPGEVAETRNGTGVEEHETEVTPSPAVVNAATATKPPDKETGARFNWWQVLLENGGRPGTVKGRKGPKYPKATAVSRPCDRPLAITTTREYLYMYMDSDFKTYFRQEIAYPRFQGTLNYFADVRGYLVWSPPKAANDTHIYAVHYVLDDTGFWVQVNALF